MFPPNELILIDLFIQALLYGMYTATLIHCLRLLLFTDDGWKLREKINWLMTVTTFFVFLLSTFNIGATLGSIVRIIRKEEKSPGTNIGDLLVTLSGCLTVLLVDVMLVYRCWLVYGKSWRAVSFPIIFWFGSMTFAILAAYYTQLLYDGNHLNLKAKDLSYRMSIAFYGCTIATNIYATCAIIYRILGVAKSSCHSSRRLYNTIRILAESGILLVSSSVIALIGVSLESIFSNDITIILFCVSDPINFSMGGITFNLILIRIYKSRLDSFGSLGSRKAEEQRTLSFNAAEAAATTPSQADFPTSGPSNEPDEVTTDLRGV